MSDSSKVRVRFAPSPTGQLHVGNARTALFNWLFARQHGGTNALRIEDTDVERSEARYEDQLISDLKWLGLDWDEGPDVGGEFGPYRQSDRMKLYHDYAERLLKEGKAYLCFCSAEELEAERKRAMDSHQSPIYSGKCRAIDPAEAQKRLANGEAAAIRLRIPERPIKFHDIVHGDVEFSNEVVSDSIIVRSSGMPVYNYVVVIDDAEMKITHVIRGDDHLSNTPKQVALYEALGWPVPEFAHLSTILGADRERLSKRHGATSIANFREMGVLPEALVNYLALLGWAPTGGTRETFAPQELVKEFSLERVTPSPAVFDMQKLYWLNRHYIKTILAAEHGADRSMAASVGGLSSGQTARSRISNEGRRAFELLQDCWRFLARAEFVPQNQTPELLAWVKTIALLILPSVDKLEDLPARAQMIFRYDAQAASSAPDNAEVLGSEKTNAVISTFAKKVEAEPGPITAERFKAIVNEVKAESGAKGKELFHPIRIVITGSHSGPEFDKLIPIIESGSALNLPSHVLSVRERVEKFKSLNRG